MSDQERANALIEQANALHNGGDPVAAAPLYVEAAGLFAPYASFALVAGDSYRAAGLHPRAVEAYRACLAGHPDHPEALQGLHQSLGALGRADEARGAFEAAGVAFPAPRRGCLARLFGG